MLGQVVAVEPGAVVGLDQPEPVLEMAPERPAAVVEMVEDPEAHQSLPSFRLSCCADTMGAAGPVQARSRWMLRIRQPGSERPRSPQLEATGPNGAARRRRGNGRADGAGGRTGRARGRTGGTRSAAAADGG